MAIAIAFDGLMLSQKKVGIGNYIFNLSMALAKLEPPGVSVDVFLQGDAAGMLAGYERPGFRVVPVPAMGNRRRFAYALLRSAKLYGKRYDLVHFPDYLLPFRRTGAKVVVTLPDLSFRKHREFLTIGRYAPKRLLYPLAIRRADAIITYSESTRKDLQAAYGNALGSKTISSIPLGVSPVFLDPAAQSEDKLAEVRERYGLTAPFFLFVGTIEPRKNLLGILQAFQGIRATVPHRFVVVGARGWRYDQVFTFLQESGIADAVSFLDYVPDVDLPAIYRLASFLAYPSFYEGFGLPIVEAFAAGVPVLTSRTSSMIEVGGDAAHYVDPSSLEDLRAGLLALCVREEYRRALVARGRQRVGRFSWDACAAETVRVYQRVLNAS